MQIPFTKEESGLYKAEFVCNFSAMEIVRKNNGTLSISAKIDDAPPIPIFSEPNYGKKDLIFSLEDLPMGITLVIESVSEVTQCTMLSKLSLPQTDFSKINPLKINLNGSAYERKSPDQIIEDGIDRELFLFNSVDTPLMDLMLQTKRVNVNSPEVNHYRTHEPRSYVLITRRVTAGGSQVVLPLGDEDRKLPRLNDTLLISNVPYPSDDNIPSVVMVTGFDTSTNNPVVRSVSGAQMPEIPQGCKCIFLSNILDKSESESNSDLPVPIPALVYLQKRDMNQIMLDYFESQRNGTPLDNAVLVEQVIANFKARANRTLWAGRPGKIKINVNDPDTEYTYCTEGIRWQFKREILTGDNNWSAEKILGMAMMFFACEDAPKTALLLTGNNLFNFITHIDYSSHPEIQISSRRNSLGWDVITFHTVFGDIDIKREPTLDVLDWRNSGALIGEDRLVHYTYSTQQESNNNMDVWDALALKGNCHIWINGDTVSPKGIKTFTIWDKKTKPDNEIGVVYFLAVDCPAIGNSAKAGQLWTVDPEDPDSWVQYSGSLY